MIGRTSLRRGAVVIAALGLASAAGAAKPITGNWLTEHGNAVVRIEPCGRALCGRIVRVIQVPGDAHKPNGIAEGALILSDLVDDGDVWKGKIHDPAKGSTYTSKVSRNAGGTLDVAGCVAFLCKTLTWHPA